MKITASACQSKKDDKKSDLKNKRHDFPKETNHA